MTSIDVALKAARQIIAPGEARLLLRHLLDCSAAHIEAHRDDELDSLIEQRFHALIERRRQGEPIAYLMQMHEFYGRSFFVAPGVLIPRPETELIVDIALGKFQPRHSRPRSESRAGCDRNPASLSANSAGDFRILDLGTGSGCLAITLALELPQAAVTAVDVSAEALAIARQNASRLSARVDWRESDWFSALDDQGFDLIVSNPPYIAAGDEHLAQGDLRFEPACALMSGADGLDAFRQIAAAAQAHLNSGGCLLFEHGYDQAERVDGLLKTNGFSEIEQHRDLAGIVRVSGGCA